MNRTNVISTTNKYLCTCYTLIESKTSASVVSCLSSLSRWQKIYTYRYVYRYAYMEIPIIVQMKKKSGKCTARNIAFQKWLDLISQLAAVFFDLAALGKSRNASNSAHSDEHWWYLYHRRENWHISIGNFLVHLSMTLERSLMPNTSNKWLSFSYENAI